MLREPDVHDIYRRGRHSVFRNYLAEMVYSRNPSSVLDIGCGFGLDLYLMSRRLLKANLVGIDINPRVVKLGNRELDDRASNAILMRGSLYDLATAPSFDVIYSHATLMYVPHKKIDGVLRSLYGKCRDRMIFAEFQDKLQFFRGKWVHNYVGALTSLGMDVNVERPEPGIFDPESDWGKFGMIIEAKK